MFVEGSGMLSNKLINNLTWITFLYIRAAALVNNCSTYPVEEASQEDNLVRNNNPAIVRYIAKQLWPRKDNIIG